ncbi:hypothetical protein V8F33_010979 [Rhypophila sp. PSN 637]
MCHYLETDDSALRTWLAGLRGHDRRVDVSRLDRVSIVTPIQARWPKCHLFDGGAIFPSLRRRLVETNNVTESLRCLPVGKTPTAAWPEPDGFSRYMLLPPHGSANALLLESPAPESLLHRIIARLKRRVPKKKPSKFLPIKDFALDKCVKDFALDPGRGRNRDGHWSTGREDGWTVLPTGRREELKQAGVRFEEHLDRSRSPAYSDGRHGRPRRRCTSLPPPGSFACVAMTRHEEAPAETPGTVKASEEIPGKGKEPAESLGNEEALAKMPGNEETPAPWLLMFPRMKLSQLDRRSRRRSHSRTRVEEMFD